MVTHFRPIFLCFLGLAFGICLALVSAVYSIWFLVATICIIGIFSILLVISRFKKSAFFRVIFSTRWYFIIILIALILGSCLYLITTTKYNLDFTPEENKYYGLSGVIDSNYIETNNGFYFFISSATVLDDGETIPLERNVYVYITKGEDTEVTEGQLNSILAGNEVFITSRLTATPVFSEDGFNSFAYKNNFQHTAYAVFDNILVMDGNLSFMDGVREHIRDLYQQFMDERYAGLAFSVLIGDKAELNHDIEENFQISGIAHVVAVSGLNTAFIMLLLLWLLKLFKANRWVKIAVVVVVLLLYAWLCDFTPSIIRASLMSVFLLLGNLFGKQSDKLNNVSLAGVIILLFRPLYILDLSFLLSFFGVFGIFMLYPIMQRAFKFLRWRPLVDSIALTVSATIGTAPLIINAFNYFSLIGFVANLVLVPLFGYAFMLLFIVTIFALIIPVLGYLLVPIQYGFWLVDKGAWLCASVPFASVYVPTVSTFYTISYYLGIFSASRYNLVSEGTKVVSTTILFAIYLFGLLYAIVASLAT